MKMIVKYVSCVSRNMRDPRQLLRPAVALVAALSLVPPASATVSAAFHAGQECAGPALAKFRPGGADFKVTLCTTTSEEAVCGHSIQLEAESAAGSGLFRVVAHKPGASFPDPTLEKISRPIAITFPPSTNDFGATRDNPAPAMVNQPLVTFTLRPSAKAKNTVYEIRLGKNSLVSVGKDGSCLQNFEVPLAAAIKLDASRKSTAKK